MRTQSIRLHAANESQNLTAAQSEIIRTDPIILVIDNSCALDHKRGAEALRRWSDPGPRQSTPPTIVVSEEDNDLPPFDYDDGGDDADPLLVMVNHALWAPLDKGEREVLTGRHAPLAPTAEPTARLTRDSIQTGPGEQHEAKDNEKTLELALSFSVPRTKSQNFQEVMREAQVVQGLIKLPASQECAPTRLLLTADRSQSGKYRQGEEPSDGRRRLLDALVAGCLGGLFVIANALHSQFLVVAGLCFAAHCVRLAVPTRLIGERRPLRLLRRLVQRRGRSAM